MVKILVTGATGYIGGSILSTLQKEANTISNEPLEFSVLIRNPSAQAKFDAHGVRSILFQGLDDLDAVRAAAAEHDVVVNTASASHDQSARAIVEGLAQRQKATGIQTVLIHTSGTSILGDHAEGKYASDRIFSDAKESIYAFEKNHPEPYGQRITDVVVTDAGAELGVKTFIVIPPTIYGRGTGWFSTISQQVPYLARLAIREGQSVSINAGQSIWNHVHMDDLSQFYAFLLRKILANDAEVKSGQDGYYFVQDGEHSWMDVSQGIAKSAFKLGLLKTQDVKQVDADWVAAKLGFGTPQLIRLGFSSK